jgi:osmoprotectant transport system substrate-binding protein
VATNRIRSLLVVGLLLGVTSGVAGCGGSKTRSVPSRAIPTTNTATAGTTGTTTTPLPGAGKPPITIGDKNFAEQFVLGQLYSQALGAQGFTVNVDRNIGTTDVTMKALLSGRLDLYPEYLDTWNRDISADLHPYRTERAALGAARAHAHAKGLELLDATPFSSVDAIVVTPAYAHRYDLHTIADLAGLASELTFGGPLQFQTSDPGLVSIEHAYGVTPAVFVPLDIGDQMNALDRGTVLAAAVGTTDGQLQVGQYALLSDPKHVFGWGNVVPVVPAKVLAAEGPIFRRTIDAVSALLSTPVMRQLNADVELSGQDPGTVARRFLQANGLIPPTG